MFDVVRADDDKWLDFIFGDVCDDFISERTPSYARDIPA